MPHWDWDANRCCMVRSVVSGWYRQEERTRVSWVVRAGIARVDTLINGYRRHSGVTGLYGFSVQYKSIEELAQAGQFSHTQISYVQELELAACLTLLGYTMRLVPSRGKGYHHTFKQRPNPHRVR